VVPESGFFARRHEFSHRPPCLSQQQGGKNKRQPASPAGTAKNKHDFFSSLLVTDSEAGGKTRGDKQKTPDSGTTPQALGARSITRCPTARAYDPGWWQMPLWHASRDGQHALLLSRGCPGARRLPGKPHPRRTTLNCAKLERPDSNVVRASNPSTAACALAAEDVDAGCAKQGWSAGRACRRRRPRVADNEELRPASDREPTAGETSPPALDTACEPARGASSWRRGHRSAPGPSGAVPREGWLKSAGRCVVVRGASGSLSWLRAGQVAALCAGRERCCWCCGIISLCGAVVLVSATGCWISTAVAGRDTTTFSVFALRLLGAQAWGDALSGSTPGATSSASTASTHRTPSVRRRAVSTVAVGARSSVTAGDAATVRGSTPDSVSSNAR